jgi:VIT1/CCC1 family predicted Fe2+/Mn2+ transporter
MNVVLWVLQGILAVKFISAAYSHGIRPNPEKMERGTKRFGARTRPLLVLASVGIILGAVALVLPAAVGSLAWLAPWAAAALAVMMLAGFGFHIACREGPIILAGLVLCAMAAFVAYGRWVLAPL